MRVTNSMIARNSVSNMQNSLSRLARTQEELATGKSMLRLSDKPENVSRLQSVKASLSYLEQYQKNVDDGLTYMELTDSSMQTLNDILSQAQELAVQGASDTYSSDEREALAEQIDRMIDEVLDLANSSIGDKYIYAGTNNGTAQFRREGDSIIYTGNFEGIYREVLSGDSYRIDAPGVTKGYDITTLVSTSGVEAQVSQRATDLTQTGIFTITRTGANTFTITDTTTLDGVTPDPNLITSFAVDVTGNIVTIDGAADSLLGLEIDLTGTNVGDQFTIEINNRRGVFGHAEETATGEYDVYNAATAATKDPADMGVFDMLFRLRDNLNNDDATAIDASIAEIKQANNQVLERRTGVGARFNHFEALQDQMNDIETKLTDTQDQLEGADMYKLSITYSEQQLTYESSLASSSGIMKMSLLDFLS
ncbi:MAG: flagellar hook-associated protein FlgL [Firmicutes bacterium]|nr:flagellar hook-associated protein FlgL [Bacillota bacterium]